MPGQSSQQGGASAPTQPVMVEELLCYDEMLLLFNHIPPLQEASIYDPPPDNHRLPDKRVIFYDPVNIRASNYHKSAKELNPINDVEVSDGSSTHIAADSNDRETLQEVKNTARETPRAETRGVASNNPPDAKLDTIQQLEYNIDINGNVMIIDPPKFFLSRISSMNLRIMQFLGCEHVEHFLRNLGSRIGRDELSASLFNSANIRRTDPRLSSVTIRNGLSLRAYPSNSPADRSCTILIALPYLPIATTPLEPKPQTAEHSVLLSQFASSQLRTSTSQTLKVSQAYCVITTGNYITAINEGDNNTTLSGMRTIAIFKPTNGYPVCPERHRDGPLTTLIDILATSIQGQEKDELMGIRAELLEQENGFKDLVENEVNKRSKDYKRHDFSGAKSIWDNISKLKRLSCNVKNIEYLLETQLDTLRQLRQIFETSSTTRNYPGITPAAMQRNVWEVPGLSREHAEELIIAILKLQLVIKAREDLCNCAKVLIHDIKDAQDFLFGALSIFAEEKDFLFKDDHPPNLPRSKNPLERIKHIKKAQDSWDDAHPLHATLREIKSAGNVISLYTVIINTFSPLAFFAGYYALSFENGNSGNSSSGNGPTLTTKRFWLPTGITTGIISFFSLIYVLWQQPYAKYLYKMTTK